SARVAPSSFGSGYFTVIFLNGTEIMRQEIPLTADKATLATTLTDAAGNYQVGLSALGTSQVTLEVVYAGDSQHWPGYAQAGPQLPHGPLLAGGVGRHMPAPIFVSKPCA